MKKIKTSFLAVLCLFVGFCCVGCEKAELIPSGYYAWKGSEENYFIFTENDIRDSYGWKIEGDIAERWTSGSLDYKANIVERDGELYFEGYKWVDWLYSLTSCSIKKQGNEEVYKVEYDATGKTITLIPMAEIGGE